MKCNPASIARHTIFASLFGVLTNFANGAIAASLNTTVQVQTGPGTCTGTGTGTDAASLECGFVGPDRRVSASGYARADYGSLGVQILAGFENQGSPGQNVGGQVGTGGLVSAGFLDTIFVDAGPTTGFLQLVFEVDGTFNVDVVAQSATSPVLTAYTAVGISVNGNSFYSKTLFDDGSISKFGNLVYDVPYSSGNLNLNVEFRGTYSCGGANNKGAESCDISSDFLNSAIIAGVNVFDADMNEIADAVLSSQSGFDYQAGYDVSAVPVPAALPLFLSGLAALGFAARRKRRQSS